MKYEAKAVSTSTPNIGLTEPNGGTNTINNTETPTTSANGRAIASIASGYPIAWLTQTTAAQYCTDSGARLITNAEWMTIARNIEAQGSNWTGGVVGTGGLWAGHSDFTLGGVFLVGEALSAGPDTDPYIGTGNTAPSAERRTHTLSNGEIIWDLSGNVWEMLNDTITAANQPTITASPGFNWREFPTLTSNGSLSYDDYRPSNPAWNSTQNVGQLRSSGIPGDNAVYAMVRGNGFRATSARGIFSGRWDFDPILSTQDSAGFRCVVR